MHSVASSGTLEKARSTPVAVIHEDDRGCFIMFHPEAGKIWRFPKDMGYPQIIHLIYIYIH